MTTFEEEAGILARHRWVERRLFELVGGWVPTVAEPAAKLALRAQSFHHAAHAELWESLLPVRRPAGGFDGPASVGLGSDVPASDVIEALGSAEGTVERLVADLLVLDCLTATYEGELDDLSVAAGRPRRRVLLSVLADIRADRDAILGLVSRDDLLTAMNHLGNLTAALSIVHASVVHPENYPKATNNPPGS